MIIHNYSYTKIIHIIVLFIIRINNDLLCTHDKGKKTQDNFAESPTPHG